MAGKIELGSPEWLATLRGLLERYTTVAGPGLNLSICEVFTSVPKHLDRNGDGVIAWHCRIVDGKLEFAEGEIQEADVKTTTDYGFILPFARTKLDPANMTDYNKAMDEGVKSGKLIRGGRPDGIAKVPPAFYGMHNELAEVTS